MENMTDQLLDVETNLECPLCGSYDIESLELSSDDDSVREECYCKKCGSRFTFGYWVKDVWIFNDGRFEGKEE